MPCGLKYQSSNMVSNVGDGETTQVGQWPSNMPMTSRKSRHPHQPPYGKCSMSTISWHTPLLSEKRHGEEDEVYNL
jgi:hypothetical protein